MIESAAQILLSVSNAKKSADNSSMVKSRERGSGSSFGDVYSQSKPPSQPDRNQAERTQTERTQSDRSQAERTLSERTRNNGASKRSENNAERSVDRNTAKNTRELAGESNARQDASVKQTAEETTLGQKTKQEITETQNAEAELADDSLTADAGELAVSADIVSEGLDDLKIKVEKEAELALSSDENKLAKENQDPLAILAENSELDKKKYTQLAQAIETELKPFKEKVGSIESPDKLSRLKIATAIEQALAKTGDNIGDKDGETKLALAEKIIAQGKLLIQENLVSPEKLAAQEKILKPELALNVNASKVLGEQIKSKDINLQSPVNLSRELLSKSEGGELASSLEKPTDALLEKILQRLDFSKLKGEENQLAKIAADKSTIADFVDQLSSKISSDASAGSLLSATNALTAKAGMSALPTQMVMNTNINQPQWGTDFSKRIQFMVNNDIKNAELRLDPPELGRINIKISMNQDQVSVAFSSANGNVRETIENALPKLREMLQESGIQLSDANVSERQKGDERQAGSDSNLAGPILPDLDDELEADVSSKAVIQHSVDGVIDYFA